MFEGLTETSDNLTLLRKVVLSRGGARLLDDLSLEIAPAGVTGLMGPNGAGKSLSLRVIAGLMRPDSGIVVGSWRRAALVFQKPVLLRRSVRANLAHALRVYGAPRTGRADRVEALLALGRLSELATRPARALSGGEQQRLALIRALAANPDLLLLDEPCASLDPQATAAVEALIRHVADCGAKVLLVTHDAGQARRMAQEVVFLHRGRLIERQNVDAFFDKPKSQEARAYQSGELLI